MSDPLALKTSDGASRVSIADPTGSPIVAPLVEISPTQAVIESDASFEPNAYLDLTLELKGQPPRKFFAHVVGPDPEGVRIRWMHLDPGEEQKLKGLLAAYARLQSGGVSGRHATRRVIKAKSETFTPFGAAPAEVQPPAPAPSSGGHKGTRRVIRAGAKARKEEQVPEPEVSLPEDESKGHPVVLATTDKFEKLRQVEPVEVVEPAKPTESAVAAESAPPVEPPAPAEPASQPTDSARLRTIGKDGRMDVGAAIRSKAKTVNASDLAARHDKVRVLNMATIKALIQEAVEEAATHLTRALGEAERKRLMEEAEDSFKERLRAFELDKKSAEEKSRVLQKDLNAAKELLEQERKRSIQADQFTVSEAGLAEIDVRMMKIIERSVSRGEAGPELELKLREMIAAILDSEREKLKEKELSAHNEKIALLEKKVSRLAFSLESTEKERDDARQLAELMEKHGISASEVKNKYQIGLSADDPNRERKLALMRELVEQNRELRKSLGMKLIDPAQAAKEAAEEEKQKKAEIEQARREALAELQASRAAGTPRTAGTAGTTGTAQAATSSAPVAQTDPEPAPEPEAQVDAAAPIIDPDDQPWDATAAPAQPAAVDERGVKVLRDYKRFEPPPLEVAAANPAEDDAEVLVDPDSLPWQPEKPA